MNIQNSKLFIVQKYAIVSVIFLLPGYLIKIKFGWVSFNIIELLIAVIFIAWIFSREKKYVLLATHYSLPMFILFASLILSVIVNKNYYIGLGAIKGWFVFPIIFAVIVYDRLNKEKKLLDNIWAALFASGFVLSLAGVYYWLSGNLTYDGRLRIIYDSPNQLAMFLAVSFLAGVLNFDKFNLGGLQASSGGEKADPWRKSMAALGVFIIFLNLCLTQSFGAIGAIAVSLAVVLWLKYKAYRKRVKVIAIAVLLFVAMLCVGATKIGEIKSAGERSSLASRLMIWKSAGLMIENNPLFGIGPGNFQNKYLEYQKYFPPYLEWAVPQPHNIFLAFWLEAGILGLAGFILLLITFFYDNKKALRANREAALVCLGIVLYFLIHGFIDTTYWRNDIAVIFWIAVIANLYLGRIRKKDTLTEK